MQQPQFQAAVRELSHELTLARHRARDLEAQLEAQLQASARERAEVASAAMGFRARASTQAAILAHELRGTEAALADARRVAAIYHQRAEDGAAAAADASALAARLQAAVREADERDAVLAAEARLREAELASERAAGERARTELRVSASPPMTNTFHTIS